VPIAQWRQHEKKDRPFRRKSRAAKKKTTPRRSSRKCAAKMTMTEKKHWLSEKKNKTRPSHLKKRGIRLGAPGCRGKKAMSSAMPRSHRHPKKKKKVPPHRASMAGGKNRSYLQTTSRAKHDGGAKRGQNQAKRESRPTGKRMLYWEKGNTQPKGAGMCDSRRHGGEPAMQIFPCY